MELQSEKEREQERKKERKKERKLIEKGAPFENKISDFSF